MESPYAGPWSIGRTRARRLAAAYGRELRIARVAAGLTQAGLARIGRVSQQEVSRAERGDLEISLDVRSRLAVAVGHDLALRLYPSGGIRLRDSGQLRLAQAIVRTAVSPWSADLEHPVASGDPRAVDVLLTHPVELVALEVERMLVDFQAQLRMLQHKRETLGGQHARPVRLVVAVVDSVANRRRLAPFRDLVRSTLPVGSRRVWASLSSGRPIGGDGLLFVREDRIPGR